MFSAGLPRLNTPSEHAMRVGLSAKEEIMLWSKHLPSWVQEVVFVQAVEQVLEADQRRAGAVLSWCTDDDDQRGYAGQRPARRLGVRPKQQNNWTPM